MGYKKIKFPEDEFNWALKKSLSFAKKEIKKKI